MLGCAGQVAIPGVFAVLLHGRWTAQSISGALGVVPLGVVPLGVVPLGVVPLGVVPLGVVPLGVVPLGVVPLLATGALLLLARALRTTQTLASLPTSGLTPHPAP
jgi:hypothetical protein